MHKAIKQQQFGQLLKEWRSKRSLSQLGLATTTGTTTRHLSFLENGRSQPTKDMILRLSEALDIPFRERNALFRAAGLREYYREHSLDHPYMESINCAIDVMLENHEPFPAFVLNRHWELVKINRAAACMLQNLLPEGSSLDSLGVKQPLNILILMFQSSKFQERILNWDIVARHLIQRIRRESFEDTESAALIEKLREVIQLPDDYWSLDLSTELYPVIPMKMATEQGAVLSLLSMVTTFGTPADVFAQELRIELVFPADKITENLLHAAAAKAKESASH